jgi:predicted transcriptional regulator
MSIKTLITTDEYVIEPFTSINSVENELQERGYLIIKDEGKFIGLLTIADVVKNGHHLAIDCYTEKTFLSLSDELDDAISIMNSQKETVLPVRTGGGRYVGSITEKKVFMAITERLRNAVTIKITNIVGNEDLENAKQTFLNDMYHNTKNPIQVIYSSIDMLKNEGSMLPRDQLLDSILKSAKQIDILVNALFQEYFYKPQDSGKPSLMG